MGYKYCVITFWGVEGFCSVSVCYTEKTQNGAESMV